jgi:hypothetical protein
MSAYHLISHEKEQFKHDVETGQLLSKTIQDDLPSSVVQITQMCVEPQLPGRNHVRAVYGCVYGCQFGLPGCAVPIAKYSLPPDRLGSAVSHRSETTCLR